MIKTRFLGGVLLLAFLMVGSKGVAQNLPTEIEADRIPKLSTKGTCFIKGGTLLTVLQGVIEQGDILIEKGKIVAIGKNLTPPPGVTVIDATGKFVMPGIVDAHSHIATDAVNEGSDSITAEVRILDTLNSRTISIYRALTNGVTSALVLHGSANSIGGQSMVIKLKWRHPVEELPIPDAPRMIKFALGENVKRAGSRGRFPNTRMGVALVYRRAFVAAQRYIQEWDQYEQERVKNPGALPPRRDLRLETLADILRGKIWVQCHSYRADEMLMMLRLSQEFHFHLTFQHALEAYKILPEIAAAGVGVSTFANFWAYKIEAYDAIPYNAALCTRAGIITSLNSDNGAGTGRLNMEAASSIAYGGLTENEALRLITLNPAIQLGIDKRTGTLDVGKDADVTLWEGNPLSSFSRCVMTLVEGEVFFQRKDAFGLDRVAATHRTASPANPDTFTFALPRAGSSYAIVGATVHPVSGAVIPEGTVLIEKDRIKAVGKDVPLPAGTVVVRAKGLHVYPGLIDSDSQLGLTEIESIDVTNDTSEGGNFQPDVSVLPAIHPASTHFSTSRVAGITTTLTAPQGGTIMGQSAILHTSGWTSEQMVLTEKNGLHIRFPEGLSAETIAALREFLSPEEIQQRVKDAETQSKVLKEYFEKAQLYRQLRQQSPSSPIDPHLEAMIPYLEGKKTVFLHVDSANGIKKAIEFAEAQKIKIVLTGVGEAWRVADLLAKKQVPVIYALPVVNSAGFGSGGRSYDPYDVVFAVPALLHRAGVKFSFASSDSALSKNLPGQVGISCAAGLPADAGLRAMTLGAAEILGISDRVGSLEVGKQADILVTNGDPLDTTTSIRYLFIGGKPVSLETKHTQLYALYRQRLTEIPNLPKRK